MKAAQPPFTRTAAPPSARPLSVSMIVPALNEADNLVETIPQAIAVLEGMNVDYEVLVIDDGSKDQTPQVMRSLCAEYPHLRSVRLRRNAGRPPPSPSASGLRRMMSSS